MISVGQGETLGYTLLSPSLHVVLSYTVVSAHETCGNCEASSTVLDMAEAGQK